MLLHQISPTLCPHTHLCQAAQFSRWLFWMQNAKCWDTKEKTTQSWHCSITKMLFTTFFGAITTSIKLTSVGRSFGVWRTLKQWLQSELDWQKCTPKQSRLFSKQFREEMWDPAKDNVMTHSSSWRISPICVIGNRARRHNNETISWGVSSNKLFYAIVSRC